ncbi:MAG TPA: hypothetical protein VIL17_07415 [Coriobacteriia bacterium]
MPYRPKRVKTAAGHIASTAPSWKRETAPESRWPAFAAALVVIAGQAWVSSALELRSAWLFPLVSAVLLGASVAVYLPEREEPSRLARNLSIGLVGVLVAANIVGLALLVRGVFMGSALQPGGLLLAGLALWVTNVAVFALVYWELDGDGPEARSDGYADYPDLVFPQQQADQQGLAPADWKPMFPDYLYVSLTSATAFSPTDAMPYTLRAKIIMGLESSICFGVLAMVVARAINIAKG